MKNPVKHIELLDYIRAIAILAVMFDHTLTNVYGYETLPWMGWFRDFSAPISLVYLFPLNLGQLGVAIFFFVSGFCIHLSFKQQGQKWRGFFIRRLFRIYPAYFVALTFFTLFFLQQAHLSLHNQQVVTRYTLEVPPSARLFYIQWWTHLFLVHNINPLTFSGITGAFWSLAVEAQLYLIYPALVWLVAKFEWRRTMIILAACEILIRGADGVTQTMDATDTNSGIILGILARSPFGYWFSWALGAFVADAFLKNQPLPFRKTSLFWWAVLALLCYVVKPLYPFCFLLFALITAIVASKLLSGLKPEIKVPAFFLKALGKIGLWSYSIYLIHQPLLNAYSNGIGWLIPEQYRSISLAFFVILVCWLLIVPFSVLWYKLFELPGIAMGKRIIRKIDSRNAAMFEPQRLRENSRRRSLVFCLLIAAFLIFAIGSLWVNAKLKPVAVESNDLAWSLATSPQAANRNGALAVKLAEEACQETQFQQTVMVGTLAAAYAEAGRFDEAVLAAQRAIALASQSGNQQLLEKNQELLDLYLKHQPYHESQTGANK